MKSSRHSVDDKFDVCSFLTYSKFKLFTQREEGVSFSEYYQRDFIDGNRRRSNGFFFFCPGHTAWSCHSVRKSFSHPKDFFHFLQIVAELNTYGTRISNETRPYIENHRMRYVKYESHEGYDNFSRDIHNFQTKS